MYSVKVCWPDLLGHREVTFGSKEANATEEAREGEVEKKEPETSWLTKKWIHWRKGGTWMGAWSWLPDHRLMGAALGSLEFLFGMNTHERGYTHGGVSAERISCFPTSLWFTIKYQQRQPKSVFLLYNLKEVKNRMLHTRAVPLPPDIRSVLCDMIN